MKMIKTHIVVAIINAVIVLLLSYWFGNVQMPLGGEMSLAVKLLTRLQSENKEKSGEMKSFLFVNTCYDIDTIPYFKHGQQEGYRSVTRRADLYKFLKYLYDSNNYKYVLLDIRMDKFPPGYNVYTDSLISLISTMPRIAVARSDYFELADSCLYACAGGVDYLINGIESGFSKFSIMQNETPSMPLKMYQDIHQRSIQACMGGLFYRDGYKLCRRTFIPTMKISSNDLNPTHIKKNETAWTYVKLDEMASHCLHNLYDEKIIVIGDLFNSDSHDTYIGRLPGAVINANIYLNCKQEKHVVKLAYVLLLGLFYIVLFLLIIISNEYNRISKSDFWHSDVFKIILSFLESGFVLSLLAVFVYCVTDSIMNIMFPVLWFTIVPKIYLTIKNK